VPAGVSTVELARHRSRFSHAENLAVGCTPRNYCHCCGLSLAPAPAQTPDSRAGRPRLHQQGRTGSPTAGLPYYLMKIPPAGLAFGSPKQTASLRPPSRLRWPCHYHCHCPAPIPSAATAPSACNMHGVPPRAASQARSGIGGCAVGSSMARERAEDAENWVDGHSTQGLGSSALGVARRSPLPIRCHSRGPAPTALLRPCGIHRLLASSRAARAVCRRLELRRTARSPCVSRCIAVYGPFAWFHLFPTLHRTAREGPPYYTAVFRAQQPATDHSRNAHHSRMCDVHRRQHVPQYLHMLVHIYTAQRFRNGVIPHEFS